nr:hypothetical protein [Tanacetum cinerariifolium]
MRWVGKGFSGVKTPLFEGMLVAGVIEEEGDAEEQVQDVADHAAAQRVDTAVRGDVVQDQSIPSPTPPPQQPQDLPSTSQRFDTSNVIMMEDASNQGRMIDDLDNDAGVALMDDKEEEKKAEEAKEDEPAKVQEVVDVVTTAKLITEVVTTASESSTIANTTISAAEPQVPAATITVVPKRPQTEAQARKNMIMYLKNVAGFRLDYFKGMSFDEIRPIFVAKFSSNIEFLLKTKEQTEEEENRALQSINETSIQKATKRRKLNKEVEDLKKHLEIVLDEDNDVYTEATPLARKVPVVDYEIIHLNNKPHHKIIRSDGTHQLYVSFLNFLKNFDRKDLESLWSLVKERFSTSKPDNFSNDFLLTTLGAMFERPDGHAQFWKNQRIAHGQAKVKSWKLLESCGVHMITFITTQLILLVERRYPLSRFTLDQMLNAVRLRVEEQSEMSLELLRDYVALGLHGISMEKGFLTIKGRGSGKGVKEKHDYVVGVHATVNDGMDSGSRTTNVTPTLESLGNTFGNTSRKSIKFCSLITLVGNGADVVVSKESWTPDANIIKEDVCNISVRLKFHDIPIIVFTKDGLSAIATKLGNPLMLDSYMAAMCTDSWGGASYARAMVELQSNVELKETIVVVVPKFIGARLNNLVDEDYYGCINPSSTQEAKQVEGNGKKDINTSVPSSVYYKPLIGIVSFAYGSSPVASDHDEQPLNKVDSNLVNSDSESDVKVAYDETA